MKSSGDCLEGIALGSGVMGQAGWLGLYDLDFGRWAASFDVFGCVFFMLATISMPSQRQGRS